jgi:hypothetical protein
MSKRTLLAALLLFAALPLHAGFDEVVNTVEKRTGLHRVSIPLMGLARFAIWIARPGGVHDFQLATFEDRGGAVDPAGLREILAKQAGPGFQPLVVTHSRAEREWTFIFARPHGDSMMEVLLATRDDSDTVVLRAVVDTDKMLAHIDEPHGMVALARR